jgi:hypothetical protein
MVRHGQGLWYPACDRPAGMGGREPVSGPVDADEPQARRPDLGGNSCRLQAAAWPAMTPDDRGPIWGAEIRETDRAPVGTDDTAVGMAGHVRHFYHPPWPEDQVGLRSDPP